MPASAPPLVVQVGFAGTRTLLDPGAHAPGAAAAIAAAARDALVSVLRGLPGELGLPATGPFLCGLSQIAVGGDTLFAEACRDLGILQRIFLPQHLDAYLEARGSRGPDFDDEQRVHARGLLQEDHVVDVQLVSDAPDRHARFRDVNLELARVSDVVVCLVRKDQGDAAGGTLELLQNARKRGLPAVILEVGVQPDGAPIVARTDERLERFIPPTLPPEMADAPLALGDAPGLPSGLDYCKALKALGSDEANRRRLRFKWAAFIIVGGHVLATLLAVLALKLHHDIVAGLLALELGLLGIGLVVHHQLHHSHAIHRWAKFRVLAEVTASLTALGRLPARLEHFFTLPFPPNLRALLRTLNILHARDTRAGIPTDWRGLRDEYVAARLRGPGGRAQIPYNKDVREAANRDLRTARAVFYAASILALVATSLKLSAVCHWLALAPETEAWLPSVLGASAIVLPVIAVAALSLATAFDLEAREGVSAEMLSFLEGQATLLADAEDPREVQRLVVETEARLLGETANWFARRSYVGIS